MVFNFGPYVRRDSYNYYPSSNPLNDLGPPNLQQESVAQQRSLTNAGAHADLSYAQGMNNAKVGGMYRADVPARELSDGIVARAECAVHGCGR